MRDRRRDIRAAHTCYVYVYAFAHRPEISFHREKKRGQLCRGRSGGYARRAVSFREQSLDARLSVSFLRSLFTGRGTMYFDS